MKADSASFQVADIPVWKRAALQWASRFSPVCFLDSNQQAGKYECLIGAGAVRQLSLHDAGGAFARLESFVTEQPSWLFGHLNYDLKNDIERLVSKHPDGVDFPLLHFFEPVYVLELLPEGLLTIHSAAETPSDIFEAIQRQASEPETTPLPGQSIRVRARIDAPEYMKKVKRLQEHILEGDIYEVNFCQEFFVENCPVQPAPLFYRLNQLSRAPFSAYYETGGRYLLCASPERFLRKTGDLLTSQPIKGTLHRGSNAEEDRELRERLFHSEKDRAENIMIVDLVRNDLARSCFPGTVHTPELFGIHAFPQVFQMISTVEGRLRPEVSPVEAIRNAFPMGSMTGAPKVMAMELIERYEQTRRGLYSGTVGYFTPDGDFDLNVVIRSLLYNQSGQYLSFQVGGAIVFDSVPEREYEECWWKARALLAVLGQDA